MSLMITTGTTLHVVPGDIVSISGLYARRTFWQWLFRRPRRLKPFVVQ